MLKTIFLVATAALMVAAAPAKAPANPKLWAAYLDYTTAALEVAKFARSAPLEGGMKPEYPADPAFVSNVLFPVQDYAQCTAKCVARATWPQAITDQAKKMRAWIAEHKSAPGVNVHDGHAGH